MMRYKQSMCWLMLVFGVTAAGFASSQTDDGASARALVIDPERFQRLTDPPPSQTLGARTPGSQTPSSQTPDHVGPRIAMRQPGEKRVFTPDEPVAVDIAFLPADDGIEPDMKTLEVTVRKGWFGMDITDMVKPYVEGTAIRMPKVEFSGHKGDFQFGISIKDRQRRGSQLWFSVKILF